MPLKIVTVANEKELIAKLTTYVEEIAEDAIVKRGKFFVGLSGGSTVKFLCESLPKITSDWSKWVLAFCDERVVSEDSDDSTFGTYKRQLIPRTSFKEEQFVKIKQGVSADLAAKDYIEQLTKEFGSSEFTFDLLLLGMGPDGHTCSLFPGHKLLDETSPVGFITDSPKPPPSRITLTYPVINRSRNCIFTVTGAEKADMVTRILKDNEDLPAGRVKPAGNLYWILDTKATSLWG